MIAAGAGVAWRSDPTFESYSDALWWAVVTSTTVGYGDLSPETPVARGVAVVVMLFGIGTVGLLTASIANYFNRRGHPRSIDDGVSQVTVDGECHELDESETEVLRVLLRGLGRLG